MSHRGKLIRLPANRVWRTYPGGRTLDGLADVATATDSHFAEDWIASTTKATNPPGTPAYVAPSGGGAGGMSGAEGEMVSGSKAEAPGISQVIVGHETTTRDFAQLLASDPEYFLGAAHVAKYGANPQVLVKFLDSGTRLHFQVHPTREFAQRVLGAPSGKTEAYHVLSVRDGTATGEATGYIYVGFQRPPTTGQLREYIATQDLAAIEGCFDKIPVQAGDTFIIPGGTPHALGAGVFMVEIQEPSDLAVRFEFERAGYVLPEASRFMNRGLDFALTVFNFGPLTAADLAYRVRCRPRRRRALGPSSYQDELIGPNQTDCFRVYKTHLDAPVLKDETSAVIAIVTAGSLMIEAGGESHRLRTFDKFFLPAGLGPVRFTPAPGGCEVLECLPPAP